MINFLIKSEMDEKNILKYISEVFSCNECDIFFIKSDKFHEPLSLDESKNFLLIVKCLNIVGYAKFIIHVYGYQILKMEDETIDEMELRFFNRLIDVAKSEGLEILIDCDNFDGFLMVNSLGVREFVKLEEEEDENGEFIGFNRYK